MLEKLGTPFAIEVKYRFDALKDEEPTVEKRNQILTKSKETKQNKTQKSTIKKSTEDSEIESLDKKRKELWQKANNTKRQGRVCKTQQNNEKEM